MHYTIYLDVLICVNLFINYFVLLSVTKFLHLKITRLRLMLAALLGAFYSIFILFPKVNIALSLIIKIIMSITICLAAFGFLDTFRLIKTMIVFYSMNFLLCAFIFFIQYFLSPAGVFIKNGIVYFKISPLFLVSSTIIIYLIFRLSDYFLAKRDLPVENCTVTLFYMDKKVSLDAKIDTGNTLREPFSNDPVIIAEYSYIESILPEDLKDIFQNFNTCKCNSSLSSYNAKFRLIPFSTISESGVLPAFKPNKVEISYLGKVLEKDAFVCACKQKIADEKFKALVSQEMVD